MSIDIDEDLGIAHTKLSVVRSLRDDARLTELIGGPERIYLAKRDDQKDEPVAVLVERVNTTSTVVGHSGMERTFHVMQVKLVMTRTAMGDRDQLFPDVVLDRIDDVMKTAFPTGSIPRGRDDAGGMDVPGGETTNRVQWPQRFRVLAYTN